jgi:hypothetical protein
VVGLQYNNGSGTLAFISDAQPKERGETQVTIDPSFLQGWDQMNLTMFWTSYQQGSSTPNASPHHNAFNVTIKPASAEHLPANIAAPSFDKKSLAIALPCVLVFVILLVLGLFFGMRKHRSIGFGSIMGRGGYGTNKSRRQRMGIEKGAIRLENREPTSPSPPAIHKEYQTDHQFAANRPAPPAGIQKGPGILPPMHNRDLSLGSLIADESARNSYR